MKRYVYFEIQKRSQKRKLAHPITGENCRIGRHKCPMGDIMASLGFKYECNTFIRLSRTICRRCCLFIEKNKFRKMCRYPGCMLDAIHDIACEQHFCNTCITNAKGTIAHRKSFYTFLACVKYGLGLYLPPDLRKNIYELIVPYSFYGKRFHYCNDNTKFGTLMAKDWQACLSYSCIYPCLCFANPKRYIKSANCDKYCLATSDGVICEECGKIDENFCNYPNCKQLKDIGFWWCPFHLANVLKRPIRSARQDIPKCIEHNFISFALESQNIIICSKCATPKDEF